jgi:hypothetical protein
LSATTILNPKYVVQRLNTKEPDDVHVEYYTTYVSNDEEKGAFTKYTIDCMIFSSIKSAARVAKDEVAEIRILVSDADMKEFSR